MGLYKNGEGYADLTAGEAIREADKPPEQVVWFVKTVKAIAQIFDLEIIGRIHIRDKKTRREYR